MRPELEEVLMSEEKEVNCKAKRGAGGGQVSSRLTVRKHGSWTDATPNLLCDPGQISNLSVASDSP